MFDANDLLEALPVAVYTTDADGNLTFYNEAAAELWGQRPELGNCRWCGSWRLYWSDGRPMPHDQCPMAVALREGRKVRGQEALAERPDGSLIPFLPCPTPLRNASGEVIGGINLLLDLSERKHAELDTARLAALVSSSDDAIISKTLEGRITSWNRAAQRIFGYTPEEMIGEHITRIIPPELQDQEVEFIAKLKRGERIEHFDTIRIKKNGNRVDVSLTISPILDGAGNVVGASKISRDITDRRENERLQGYLFDELNHRVKNMLSTVQAIARQGLRTAKSPGEFVTSFGARLEALAQAHDLVVQRKWKGAYLAEIVRRQVLLGSADHPNIKCCGPDVLLSAQTTVHLSSVLHELATNARKYGALSVDGGRLTISWKTRTRTRDELILNWKERGVHNMDAPSSPGFGTDLIEQSLKGDGGDVSIQYCADGLDCEIRLPLATESQQESGADAASTNGRHAA